MLFSKLWAFYKKNIFPFAVIERPVKLVNKNVIQRNPEIYRKTSWY